MRTQLMGLSLTLVALSACSSLSPSSTSPSVSSSTTNPATVQLKPATTEPLQETLAKYEEISEKMTLDEVEAILGKPDVIDQLTMPNSSPLQIYVWKNANGSTIKAQFQNRLLVNKTQLGLISTVY